MKVLFLTSNDLSGPLERWLSQRAELTTMREKLKTQDLMALNPALIVSYSYGHILNKELLDLKPGKFINLHIAFLPYNRGADPNAWSFLENTPKGVSIHVIDPGIDTGAILAQKQVTFDESRETLCHSYATLQSEIQELFKQNWDSIKNGTLEPTPQTGKGTFHKTSDFSTLRDALLGPEGWDVPISVFKERYRRLAK